MGLTLLAPVLLGVFTGRHNLHSVVTLAMDTRHCLARGVRGRVRVTSHVFLALCLRLVIAIANYERGSNPGKTTIKVCQ